MTGMLRGFLMVLALSGWIATVSAALAQTRPAVTSLGPDFPKSEIFIGKSFFYYNNSMHSHVLAMQRAADPSQAGLSRHLGDDRGQ